MLSTRRFFLKALGGVGTLSLLHACSNSSTATEVDGGTSGTTDGGTTTTDSGTSGGIDSSGFAIGSGAYVAGKDYGDPFDATATTCTVYTSATKGPCHSNTYERQDVSDGLVGLPIRFALRIVDTSCNPIAGAIVEIWYASPAGTYSEAATAGTGSYQGSLSDLNVSFCTGNNSAALAANWLRGYQTTDSDGRVTFDSIFPGWYSSRTTHVHFIVSINGKATDTSQLMFDETLTTAIYTEHTSYKSRGNKDTTNANDNVIKGGLALSTALMSYAQQSDGAILLWKQIAVATS